MIQSRFYKHRKYSSLETVSKTEQTHIKEITQKVLKIKTKTGVCRKKYKTKRVNMWVNPNKY